VTKSAVSRQTAALATFMGCARSSDWRIFNTGLGRMRGGRLSGVYRFPATDSVVFGQPFVDAIAQEVDRVGVRPRSASTARTRLRSGAQLSRSPVTAVAAPTRRRDRLVGLFDLLEAGVLLEQGDDGGAQHPDNAIGCGDTDDAGEGVDQTPVTGWSSRPARSRCYANGSPTKTPSSPICGIG
jgi:hypothetical protein